MNEIMSETGRFTATGVMDEKFLSKHARYTDVGRKMTFITALYLLMSLAWLGLYLHSTQGWLLVLLGVCSVFVWLQPRRCYQRWLEKHMPDDEMAYTVSCTDRGVMVENQANGDRTTMDYAHIDRVVETEETLLVLSRAKQMTAFFKASLTEQECGELLDYLRGKGIRVKSMK